MTEPIITEADRAAAKELIGAPEYAVNHATAIIAKHMAPEREKARRSQKVSPGGPTRHSDLEGTGKSDRNPPQEREISGGTQDLDLVTYLARELYDGFVMGGWEPRDSYQLIEAALADFLSQKAP